MPSPAVSAIFHALPCPLLRFHALRCPSLPFAALCCPSRPPLPFADRRRRSAPPSLRQFEITLNAYGCFPVVDEPEQSTEHEVVSSSSHVDTKRGAPSPHGASHGASTRRAAAVPGRGLEFVLSAAIVAADGEDADEAMRSLVANVSAFLLARYDGGGGVA